MNLDTLISSNAVIVNPEIKSKKRALELLSEKLATEASLIHATTIIDSKTEVENAEEEIDSFEIFQLLTDREKLGSTSLGHGVALPHARTSHTEQAIGVFLKLEKGIDFDSPDNQPTDLIFALMVPEHYTDEHLKILANLAALFNDEALCQKLRSIDTDKDIYKNLVDWQTPSNAS